VDADKLDNFEAGLKSDWFDKRLLVDLAGYFVNWKDIPAAVDIDGVNTQANAGDAKLHGGELTVTYAPLKGLRLGANAAYVHAELTSLSSIALGFGANVGDRLPLTPTWNASVTVDYDFPVGRWAGQLGGGYRFVGTRPTDFPGSPVYALMNQYSAVDLHAGLSLEKLSLHLFAKNVTNTRAVLGLNALTDALSGEVAHVDSIIMQPRTIGVGFDVKL
jgi:iron complex outermembrane recepter protein